MDAHANARFLVVTDSPPLQWAQTGRMLSPQAMGVFKKGMQKEQFRADDFAFVPQVRCPHDPDKLTGKERTAVQSHCRQYLLDDIEEMRPEVVIPLGAAAAKQALGKAVKITKVAGVAEWSEEFSRTLIYPMISPLQVALYPQHEPTFAAQCATLGRLVDHGYDVGQASRSVVGKYEIVEDLQFLIDADPEIIAYDTEGDGLGMPGTDNIRWYAPDARILTMQFCIEPGKAYLLPWDKKEMKRTARQKHRLKQQFIRLMCDPKRFVVGQNAKFDALLTWRILGGVRYRIGGDTLMLASLIDENAYTKNQADLIKRYVPEMAGYSDRFDKVVDKSRMDDYPLNQDFIDYGCGDADGVLRLHDVLYPMVAEDPKLLAHYLWVSLPGINAFTGIEPRGMLVDESEVEHFEAFMKNRVQEMYASLLKQVPRSIKRAHVEKGLKFSRPDFVRDILFYHPDGFRLRPRVFTKGTAKVDDPSKKVASISSKDHLPFFFDECPFTFELAQYIKDERLLGTNVIGFKNKYIVDGMVRPSYRMDVTVTGRTSSEDPNGQNFPKRTEMAKAYRKLYVAPEGAYFLEADLSQAELRIAGDMANDPTIINIYRTGGDIHVTTACIVMGVSLEQFHRLPKEEQKAGRQKAKAVNFGFLYGMGWRKFIVYAKTQYGVEFTEAEAQRIRAAFFDTYFKLPEWHNATRERVRRYKQVRSYSGRIRHLPMIDSPEDWIRSEAERQAINSPVQEFASSLGVMALSRLEEEIDPQYLQVVSFVHDAIYCIVPQEYLEWGALTLKRYMESNPIEEAFGVKLKLPIEADASFGINLGEMYELKGLKLPPRTVRGRAAYEPYDWSQFWNDEKQEGIIVPEQRTPPNGGLRTVPVYTQVPELVAA